MNDRIPGAPGSQDFREVAERSRAAGIADESAGYVNASAPADAGGGDGECHSGAVAGDGTGADAGDGAGTVQVPEGLADETAEPVETTPDRSDSIEPFHIPGSAEDIHVDSATGPRPSG